jgi:hypothetical protein
VAAQLAASQEVSKVVLFFYNIKRLRKETSASHLLAIAFSPDPWFMQTSPKQFLLMKVITLATFLWVKQLYDWRGNHNSSGSCEGD